MPSRLAKKFPTKLILGMELRDKISEFVKQRIGRIEVLTIILEFVFCVDYLREVEVGSYQNVSCIRANAMKQLPNYFKKGQLEKLFFLFPDPHFKAANHRRRIINTHLLTVYAYFVQPGGLLYATTDVQELAIWMVNTLSIHNSIQLVNFRRRSSMSIPCLSLYQLKNSTVMRLCLCFRIHRRKGRKCKRTKERYSQRLHYGK